MMTETQFAPEEKSRIEDGIREKYRKVAVDPEGLFKYPTGRAGLNALKYNDDFIEVLPESVAAAYCGVGNVFSLGPIHESEKVLDVGCGAGVDTLIAGMVVGPEGHVIGVDIVPDMLKRANRNLREVPISNVSFQQASAEGLPFPDESFDVVISNGVFNLVPDKRKALSEVFRVLKPKGRLMIADQIWVGPLHKGSNARIDKWSQ
jgi:arsenite methyltransferase